MDAIDVNVASEQTVIALNVNAALQGATGPTGPQGIPGPAGATGLKGDKGDKGDTGTAGQSINYVHTQTAAATVWTIPHNLNKYPSVTVVVGGQVVVADTAYVDLNVVQITHGYSAIGAVYCN
jgi:hypothetical protein